MEVAKELVHKITKIFEMGLQDEYLLRSINKILKYEKEKTEEDIRLLRKDLDNFERDYNMTSEEFFNKFEKGELGDKENFFEWSAIFQMHKRSMDKLRVLEEVS